MSHVDPGRSADAGGEPTELIAYEVSSSRKMSIVAAPSGRDWMAATKGAYANRCLPLLIANQAGWMLLNPHRVEATWRGGDHIEIRYDGEQPADAPVLSKFGHGILTWRIPYLFRTSPGFNLLVRGPSNWPKDGATPLDGIVETDWSPATFTMNWQLTRIGHAVRFEMNEPICMIVPQRRGELESIRPRISEPDADPDLWADFLCWRESRRDFLSGGAKRAHEGGEWQKHYFRGTSPSGTRASEHQTRLHLRPFENKPTSKQPEKG